MKRIFPATILRNGGSYMITITKALPDSWKERKLLNNGIPVIVRVVEADDRRIVLEITRY